MTRARATPLFALAAAVSFPTLAGCGPVQYKPETTPSTETKARAEQTGKMYEPPKGAPIPGGGGGGYAGMQPPPGYGGTPPTGSAPAPSGR